MRRALAICLCAMAACQGGSPAAPPDAPVTIVDAPAARDAATPPLPDAAVDPDGGTDGGDAAAASIQLSWLDRTAAPCDDFYRFACGGWMAQNPLRPGESVRSTYYAPEGDVYRVVYATIDAMAAARTTATDPETITIGNHYQSCMEAAAQPAARDTLRAVVAMVDGVQTVADLGPVAAELRKRGAHTFFLLYAGIDPGASAKYVLTVDQGARRLPTRDYYFDPALQAVRDAYRGHITRMAALVGVTIDADAVIRVETAIAQGELTPAQKRDPVATYNEMPPAELFALAPHFPWRAHLDALGIGPLAAVQVTSPGAVRALEAALTTLPVADLRHYLRWVIIDAKAALLDQPVADEEFAFHDRVISGATVQPTRRALCLYRTRNRFPWELSRPYVQKYFPPASRRAVQAIVNSLRATFARRILSRPWLDEPTRKEALAKLDAMGEHLGAPDLPPLTRAAPLRPPIEDDLAGTQGYWAGIVAALKAPVNHQSWHGGSEPIVVNAFYQWSFNDINVPAAILHLPHFEGARSRVANYGAIGTVIGHELTHGFDDQGRQYDGTGSLRQWWTPAVSAEFVQRAQCLGDQFARFEASPGLRVDADLTMGENVADLGGLRLGYEAFLEDARGPSFDGFDDRQQFFIAAAQIRCTSITTEYLNKLTRTDPHAPDPARVNLIVAQMPEFAEAFACPASAPLRASPACELW
jgi:putative endopeptidase